MAGEVVMRKSVDKDKVQRPNISVDKGQNKPYKPVRKESNGNESNKTLYRNRTSKYIRNQEK